MTSLPLYHYALLKGHLLGQNAPADFLASLEALYAAAVQVPLAADAKESIACICEAASKLSEQAAQRYIDRVDGVYTPPTIPALPTEEFVLPQITPIALDKLNSPVQESPPTRTEESAKGNSEETDEDKVQAFLRPKGPTVCPPERALGGNSGILVVGDQPDGEPVDSETPSRKPRKPLSEESKAKLRAALEKARAAKQGKKEPRVDTPPERLISEHKGYAGKRDPQPNPLLDSDWPDVKNMLERQRRSVSQIAGDYEVDFETMRAFIDQHSGGETQGK